MDLNTLTRERRLFPQSKHVFPLLKGSNEELTSLVVEGGIEGL